jgi:hypothetical protein
MSENAGQLILDEHSFAIFNSAVEIVHGVGAHELADQQRQFAIEALRTGLTALAKQPDRVVSSMRLNGEAAHRSEFTQHGFHYLLQTALSRFTIGALYGHEISICVQTNETSPTEQKKIVVIAAA